MTVWQVLLCSRRQDVQDVHCIPACHPHMMCVCRRSYSGLHCLLCDPSGFASEAVPEQERVPAA